MLDCGRFSLDLTLPRIMGIVNVTPDSFFDGGRDAARAVEHGLRLVDEGADLLDIGGESTRPGAEPVGVGAELARVLPVLDGLAHCGVPLSIDTMKTEVMVEAIAAGADLINDVRALQAPGAIEAVAAGRVGVCLMHMRNEPRTMQQAPDYVDVVAEVADFLAGRISTCVSAGVSRSRLLVDPGFGFGKTLEHNLALLRGLPHLARLGVPLLVGLSRKSMLGALTGRPVGERLPASVAAALLAFERGARIVRVHDVAATRDALSLWKAVRESA